jgi:Transposase DDE domain
MRSVTGGVAHMACAIERDLFERDTGLHKPHMKGLADLAASMLSCRCVNTSDLLAVLPRSTMNAGSRFRYIHRWLSNVLIDPWRVMAGFVPELALEAAAGGKTIVLMLDQTKIADGFECLMVSLRVGERAVPVCWTVKETSGGIGFDIQKPLLEAAARMMPDGAEVLLAGDRFYGTAALIRWCLQQGWNYRLRLKGNLIVQHEGGEITTGEAAEAGIPALLKATLGSTDVQTHIGILQEKGHKEPWIIAMRDTPSKARVLDYGMRWGIEPMFSDFKSRGFTVTKTQLKHPDRIERLILILTIALYWATSTGMAPLETTKSQTQKNRREASHPHSKKACENSSMPRSTSHQSQNYGTA